MNVHLDEYYVHWTFHHIETADPTDSLGTITDVHELVTIAQILAEVDYRRETRPTSTYFINGKCVQAGLATPEQIRDFEKSIGDAY